MTYSAYLDEGTERWLHATARRNLWRVSAWYDYDDLVQDGYVCFQKCVNHYGRLQRKRRPKKNDRRNFMALVKRTFENHIHDLATAHNDQRVEKTVSAFISNDIISTEAWLERHGSVEEALGDVTTLVRNAPREIKKLIELLASDVRLHPPYERKKARGKPRETNNEYWCRVLNDLDPMLKLDPNKVDIEERCRRYFAGP